MVSYVGANPALPVARVPSFPRRELATRDPVPGTVAEQKLITLVLHGVHSHNYGCKHCQGGGNKPTWVMHDGSMNSTKQHIHHCSKYDTLREEQSILQQEPQAGGQAKPRATPAQTHCALF